MDNQDSFCGECGQSPAESTPNPHQGRPVPAWLLVLIGLVAGALLATGVYGLLATRSGVAFPTKADFMAAFLQAGLCSQGDLLDSLEGSPDGIFTCGSDAGEPVGQYFLEPQNWAVRDANEVQRLRGDMTDEDFDNACARLLEQEAQGNSSIRLRGDNWFVYLPVGSDAASLQGKLGGELRLFSQSLGC